MADGLLPVPRQPVGLLSDPYASPLDKAYGLLGADPSVDRGAILPIGTDAAGEMVFAWPGMALDMVKNFLLPGHVVQGGAWSPQDVTEMAVDYGLLGTGATAARGLRGGREGVRGLLDPSTARMFAGEGAKTADKAALATAKRMASEGIDRAKIWRDTGWFKDVDGKWKWEIDDSASAWADRGYGAMAGDENLLRMGDALNHPQLQSAYPEMSDKTGVMFTDGGLGDATGNYSKDLVTIDRVADKDTLLHEVQHAIQDREGFAQGGSPTLLPNVSQDLRWKFAREAYEESAGDNALLRELGVDVPDKAHVPWEQLTDRQRLEWLEQGRERAYRRLAGEVEARNVQSRMNMTPEQRRMTPPWDTADVPEKDRIVRGILAP